MKWVCDICGYIHDEEELPDGCPVCGASKDNFTERDEDSLTDFGDDFDDDDDYFERDLFGDIED